MRVVVPVVNCFQISIFALVRTTSVDVVTNGDGVVNCFQISIFALVRTTAPSADAITPML